MIRQLEPATLLADGAGKGSALVSEELALEERVRQRRAVDGDKRPVRARAVRVNRVRDQLLPGPAFAAHQHRRVGCCHPRDESVDRLHRGALADEVVLNRRVLPKARVFAVQPFEVIDTFERKASDRSDGRLKPQVVLAETGAAASSGQTKHAMRAVGSEEWNTQSGNVAGEYPQPGRRALAPQWPHKRSSAGHVRPWRRRWQEHRLRRAW